MKKQVAINMIAQIFMFSVNLGISFFLVPYITKIIGVEAYGFIGLANDFVGYAQIITIAINSMASRFITIKIHENKIEEANKYYSSVVISNLILAVFLLVVGTIFILFMDNFINIPTNLLLDIKLLFSLIFLNFIISILTSTFSVATFCTNKLYLTSIKTIISQIIRTVVLLGTFLLFKPSVYYVGLASVISTSYLGFCNYRYSKQLTPELKINKNNFNLKYIKKLISSGIWNTISRISGILSTGLDLLISNIFIGATGMGIISVSKTIPNTVLSAFGTITSVYTPELTISYAKKDYNDMKLQLLNAVKLLGLLSAIPLSILLSYGNNFYSIWTPTQNAELLYYLTIFGSIGLAFSLPLEPLWNVFTVTNKVKTSSIYLVANSILTLLVTVIILFVVKDNMMRMFIVVGVSTIFSLIRSLTFLPIYGAKSIHLPKYTFYPAILKNVFLIIISTLFSFGIKKIININSWITLIFAAGITSIFVLILSLFIVLNKVERKQLLKKIKDVLIKKIFKNYYEQKKQELINKCLKDACIDENTILFESEGDFADNARVLYEYMIENEFNKKYKIIWIVDEPKLYPSAQNVIFISRKLNTKKDIINFYKEVGSAKYLFFTHPYWYKKVKDEQVIINLWHGIPLKAGGRDLHEIYDYITVPSDFSKELFHKFVGSKESQYLITGSPRNDLLFTKSKSINRLVDTKTKPKIIICMTTFKQSTNMQDSSIVYPYVIPFVNSIEELQEVNDQLVKLNIKIIIKIHHLQKTELLNKLNLSNIIFLEDTDLLNQNIQLYELIGQTDALITDYSSIMFDFMLLDKPIGYFINDLEEYKKTRGFLVNNVNDYMIGHKMQTDKEFYAFLKEVSAGIDKYKEQRNVFNNKMNKYKKNNCKRLLDILKIN